MRFYQTGACSDDANVRAASASSRDGKLLPEGVKGLPKVWEKQDGGMFDVEVHPEYANGNGWIYLVLRAARRLHSAPASSAGRPLCTGCRAAAPTSSTQAAAAAVAVADLPRDDGIIRGRISKTNEWVDQQVLFRAPTELYSQATRTTDRGSSSTSRIICSSRSARSSR